MKPKFTLSETMNCFSTEEASKDFLQERRWLNGVKCPRCNDDNVYALKARPFPGSARPKHAADGTVIVSLSLPRRVLRIRTIRSRHGFRSST